MRGIDAIRDSAESVLSDVAICPNETNASDFLVIEECSYSHVGFFSERIVLERVDEALCKKQKIKASAILYH